MKVLSDGMWVGEFGWWSSQVYGHMGEPTLSAQCCAKTLNLQILDHDTDLAEWAQNAAQLAGT